MASRRRVRLLTLGPPEVRAEDARVRVPPKPLALLVYVAAGTPRGSVRRDELLALFWPDRDADHARNALNQALHQLRSRLGNGILESRGKDELLLDGRVGTDLERFRAKLEAARREDALELYQGRFLEGFHVRGAPAFERWMDGVRARLRRRVVEATLELANERSGAGRVDEALEALRRAQEVLPSEERIGRGLIRLLLRADGRSAAVREYRRLALRLERELGTRPSEETRVLIAEAGVDPADVPGAPDVASLPSAERRLAAELTDRAGELLREGPRENAAARELLRQAIRLEPAYAPAHARQARAIGDSVELFGGAWEELGGGLARARRAVRLAPDMPDAHLARAVLLENAGRLADAEESYRATLELRPGDPTAASRVGRVLQFAGDLAGALRWLDGISPGEPDDVAQCLGRGMIRHALGQHDRAGDLLRLGLEKDPGNRWIRSVQVFFDRATRRFDLALREARKMLDREPDSFRGHFSLGNVALAAGDGDRALRHLERCWRLDPDGRYAGSLRAVRTALGHAHLRHGDQGRGRELLAAAERKTRAALDAGADAGGLHYDLASIHAARGEDEPALDRLERACRAGWLQHELLGVDPLMASLRGRQRFEAVRQAMERDVAEQRARVG